MMNMSITIMERAINHHVEDIIQEILREIYIANTASIILEGVVVKELTQLG